MSPGPFFLHSIHSLCPRPLNRERGSFLLLLFFSCPVFFCPSFLSHYHSVFLSFPLLILPLCTPSTLYSLAPCQSEVFPSYLSPLSIFLPFLSLPCLFSSVPNSISASFFLPLVLHSIHSLCVHAPCRPGVSRGQ